MNHKTKMPRWMHGAALVEADQWVAAPTRAQTVCRLVTERDGHLPDPAVINTWRYRFLGRPLIHLVDLLVGQKLGRLTRIGAYIVMEGPEESFSKDEAINELYAEHNHAKATNRRLQERLRAAEQAATAGENLARALRRVDDLIDEKGHQTR
ncbi:hypothetical protein [Brachybacterium alimentarium]|uniref:hypothetical protein n=1 Tax=Brachybacterium alimentarium TaxID=47845 RepID=UPI000DF141EF|nr:hypothetical protein [Brachybacterium alimentarium]RCS81845.1 hypothetical protein CIK67_15725 [Brachybacterium alimentarium]